MSYRRSFRMSFMPPLTWAVKYLVIFTSIVFILTYIPADLWGWDYPYVWLGLRPYDVTHNFYLWEMVTYLFMHGGIFHIFFNLFLLWMFGSDLEQLWGSQRFLFYFFLTGAGAGLFDVLVHPSDITMTVGNSGAVYGLLLAYGLLFPERPVFLWLIIPIKAKWFVVFMGAIEFLSSLGTPGSNISHVAHLGGMLFGFLYLRGGGLSYRLQLRYHEWRRARLRHKFELYMRKHEKNGGKWIN